MVSIWSTNVQDGPLSNVRTKVTIEYSARKLKLGFYGYFSSEGFIKMIGTIEAL